MLFVTVRAFSIRLFNHLKNNQINLPRNVRVLAAVTHSNDTITFHHLISMFMWMWTQYILASFQLSSLSRNVIYYILNPNVLNQVNWLENVCALCLSVIHHC